MHKTLEMIEEKLDRDICDLIKKDNLSQQDLVMLGEAVDILKDISTIEAMERYGGDEDNYSSASYARGMRSMDYRRMHEYSDARGRSPVTGRYVSRDDRQHDDWTGKSGHSINDRMIDNIERMYDNAQTDNERAELQDVINYIQRKNMG